MNKFEQLIEYVINDEQAKARELFHDIVVEKSRTIYEEMMEKEEIEEDAEEEIEEGVEEIEEGEEEEIEEGLGGDAADDMIDDIEVEEEGMSEGEGEEEFGAFGGEEEGEGDLEDRVVDLEDKLDELMAEFESLMGDEAGEGHDDFGGEEEFGDDDFATDDGFGGEEEGEEELETEGMLESVSLKSTPAPTKSEEGGINKKSIVAANSGARGALAKPVTPTGTTAQGRTAPGTKDLIGKVGNSPAQSTQKPTPATKPSLGQASGVNNKSVIQ